MFTIITAKPGDAWHKLQPHGRLHEHTNLDSDFELEVAVRVDYADLEGPYLFKFWIINSFDGSRLELITYPELASRRGQAADNGGEYDGKDVVAFHSNSSAVRYTQRLRKHFEALMALELFTLPVNI